MYSADSRFAKWDANSIDLWAQHLDDFVGSSECYVARADSICTAAHARFNDELSAARIEMEQSPEDDGSGLQLVPSNDGDLQAFEDAARRIEREDCWSCSLSRHRRPCSKSSMLASVSSSSSPKVQARPTRRTCGGKSGTWDSGLSTARSR
jgi:hypothetical protein